MITKAEFKQDMMLAKIAEQYGSKSFFSEFGEEFRFNIMSKHNGIPHRLQPYNTGEVSIEKAIEKVYLMAQMMAQSPKLDDFSYPTANSNRAFGQT